MLYVQSSAMSKVEWSEGTLTIWFAQGKSYNYYGVPESVYLGLLRATSKGEYFNDHIRDRYSDRRF